MNIVIVSDFAYVNNGGTKVAITEAVALADRGYNVVFFSSVGPIEDVLKTKNVNVICLNQTDLKNQFGSKTQIIHGAIQGIWNTEAKNAFKQLLKNMDPDDTIVHFHSWSHALSLALFSVTKKFGLKTIITCHDYELSCPIKMYYNFNTKKICQYKARSVKCMITKCDKRSIAQKLYRFIRQDIMIRLLNKNDLSLIFLSEFNKKIISRDIKLKYKDFVVPNPIDIQPVVNTSPQNNDKYIFIGRLSPEKGAELFCQAVTRANVKAEIIGNGDDFERLKSEYPNIIFRGWLKPEQMREYIVNARCLIMPSLWYEGAPLTIPEVQCAYALPCIVPAPSGAETYIRNGVTGWIYKSGDISNLINCIEESKEDERIKTMSENCRLIEHAEFNINTHMDKLESVYKSVLSMEYNHANEATY